MRYLGATVNSDGSMIYSMDPNFRADLISHYVDVISTSNGEEKIKNIEILISIAKDHDIYIWAQYLSELGNTLQQTDSLDSDENFERAIRSYELASTVFKLEDYPGEFIHLNCDLGTAYLYRKKGIFTENIEKAIEFYNICLTNFEKETDEGLWGIINNNLGLAYLERLEGDKNENIEKAIEFFDKALSVRSDDEPDIDWAKAHLNLGLLFTKRGREREIDNLNRALNHFQSSLKFLNQEDHVTIFSIVQNNLGNVYLKLAEKEQTDVIDHAIDRYKTVLTLISKESNSLLWANVNNNLGLAFAQKYKEEKPEGLESAVGFFYNCFEVYNKEKYPKEWATIITNLLNLHESLDKIGLVQLLSGTIGNSIEALQILESHKMYYEYVSLCIALGNIHFKSEDYVEAQLTYEKGYKILEEIRACSIHEESSKMLSIDYAHLYAILVYCCIKNFDYEKAIVYSLSNKSRTLINSITTDQKSSLEKLLADNGVFREDWEQLKQKHDEVDKLNSRFFNPNFRGNIDLLSKEIDAKQAELTRETNNIVFKYPDLKFFSFAPAISVEDLKSIMDKFDDTVILEYINHFGGIGVFVIVGKRIYYYDLFKEFPKRVSESIGLLIKDKLWNKPEFEIEERLIEMNDLLVKPFSDLLIKEEIIISPTGPLYFIPFQALLNSKKEYLSEIYTLKFIPNLLLLNRKGRLSSSQLSERNKLEYGLVISNPTLKGVKSNEMTLELSNLDREFKELKIIEDNNSEIENIIHILNEGSHNIIHFLGHGVFKRNDPASSGLILSNGTIFSVSDVELRVKLQESPLVVLAACQTGQIRFDWGDESIGLTLSFLIAGASNVICSQWSVNDKATRWLFFYFYRILKNSELTYSKALNEAMKKIRGIPTYKNPKFWAGFNVFGID